MDHILSTATIGETTETADNVCTAIEKAAIADNYLAGECSLLKQKASDMRKGIGTAKGKELTPELETADDLRDSLLSALIHLLRGFILWNSKPCLEAASLLMKIVDNHGGNFSRMNAERESANYDSLLDEFAKPEALEAFATLRLTTLAADMKSAETNFKALYQQSAEIESGKNIVSPSSIKRDTQTTLNNITDYLTTMNRANSAVYGVLAANVATLVNSVNSKVKVRAATKPESDTPATESK
jgi:hypothetical protein